MMRKEIFKNITLVTLIFISVLLFSKIWSGDYLIYGDRLFFGNSREAVQTIAVEGIIMPKRIVITGNDKRCCILKGTNEYSNCYSVIRSFFTQLESTQMKFTAVEERDWTAALKSKSVLLDYGSIYSDNILSKITLPLPEGEIKEIIVSPGNSVMSSIDIYIKNVADGGIYKASAAEGHGSINGLITSYLSNENVTNLPFAFELGFDRVRTVNEDISQNTLLDSNIIIGLKDITIPGIEVIKPQQEVMSDDRTTEGLLTLLGFKPVSTRRYIEQDGALVFVDSTATLKLHSQGFIEYTAESGGIPITDSGMDEKDAAARAVETIYSLVRNISKACGVPEHQIQIYSDITDSITGSSQVYMDYYFNGTPVIISGESGAEHTISAEVKDGSIVKFKQYLYDFKNSGTKAYSESMVSAINKLNENYKNASMNISDIYNAYVCTDGDISVRWCAREQNSDTIEIIN